MSIDKAPYPYVITACPDGEGAWYQEAVRNNPEIAATCKDAYKGKWTQDFVDLTANWVRDCELPLTMVDIGGKIDCWNRQICKSATHIVILAGNGLEKGQDWGTRIEEWRGFAKELGLTVMAEIFSDYCGQQDVVEHCADNVLRGSVHYLERGQNIAARPMVQALARHLLDV